MMLNDPSTAFDLWSKGYAVMPNASFTGNFGNNTVDGGSGYDTFLLNAGVGRDIITDYNSEEDRIKLLISGITEEWQGIFGYDRGQKVKVTSGTSPNFVVTYWECVEAHGETLNPTHGENRRYWE